MKQNEKNETKSHFINTHIIIYSIAYRIM